MLLTEYNAKHQRKLDQIDAREEGRLEGIDRSINALLETCQEFDESYEDTVSRIKRKFDISAEEAESFVSKYWNK